jgi:hypothetical protein
VPASRILNKLRYIETNMKIIKVDGRSIVNKRTCLGFTCGVKFPQIRKGYDGAWDFWRVVVDILGPSEDLMPAWPGICLSRAHLMKKAGWTRYYPIGKDRVVYFLRKEDMEKAIAMFNLKH